MPEIAKVAPTHDSMIDWVMQNPGATLAQMGQHFGYSVGWLSTIMNSDLWREQYLKRRMAVESAIAADIPTRLRAIAQVSLDKLLQKATVSEDPDFLLELADKSLHRLGFAPARGPQANVSVTQNNTYIQAPADALANARALMSAGAQAITNSDGGNAPRLIEHEPLPAPARV